MPGAQEGRVKEKKSSGHINSFVSDSLELRRPGSPMVATPVPVPMDPQLTQFDEPDTAILQPEAWLKRIKQLRQSGKLEEAKKELAAFKKRYPDYSVPKDQDAEGSRRRRIKTIDDR